MPELGRAALAVCLGLAVYAVVAAMVLLLFFEFVVNRKLLPSNF